MGSPQNYYGVGLFIDAADTTGLKNGTPGASGSWATPEHADGTNDNVFASSTTATGSAESWGNYGLLSAPNALPLGAPVDGIEVLLSARSYHRAAPRPRLPGPGAALRGTAARTGLHRHRRPARRSRSASTETASTLGSATSTALWAGRTLGPGMTSTTASTWHA